MISVEEERRKHREKIHRCIFICFFLKPRKENELDSFSSSVAAAAAAVASF